MDYTDDACMWSFTAGQSVTQAWGAIGGQLHGRRAPVGAHAGREIGILGHDSSVRIISPASIVL